MHLETLEIENFRSVDRLTVPLRRDLTIFVGENNGGKSNVIDAMRLLTAPLTGRRELYCESTDIRFGSTTKRFSLVASYAGLTPHQQGRLLTAVSDTSMERARFQLVYDESSGRFPYRPMVTAGTMGSQPEPGAQDTIRHVYLPPLRDAKRALASGNPTHVHALLRHFLGQESSESVARALGRNPAHDILAKVDSAVEVGLSALTSGLRRQGAAIGFASNEKLIDIARDLRFKLADHGVEPEELQYSGHGYANLLYMATIAVQLEKASHADLTLFLVEEPEAHLHPQLQAAVLSFLQERAEASKVTVTDDKAGPAGELQVVVATHSPNLSAWVPGRNIVVFKSTEEPIALASSETATVEDQHTAAPLAAARHRRRATRCIPLDQLGLPDAAWRKVDRYLDVTKSALLFGGRALLVEGIAEALLLPVIARKHTLKSRRDDLRTFRSAVFLPIDGVDFEPYVRLLLTAHGDTRIADRVVVITDGDTKTGADATASPGTKRAEALEVLAQELGAGELLTVCTNSFSLESALIDAGNADLLRQVFLDLHPQSADKWDQALAAAGTARASAVRDLFDDIRKGDFAQILAERIAAGEEFKVPVYLAEAIEAVVK